jgi:hypothetical protein
VGGSVLSVEEGWAGDCCRLCGGFVLDLCRSANDNIFNLYIIIPDTRQVLHVAMGTL